MSMAAANGSRASAWMDLPVYDAESGALNVVIETVQGSHCKVKLDVEHGLFKLGEVLPAGSVFPYDFGFVPSTRGDDGDPLDVLVLMDAATFPGCLVPCRLLGVLESRQREKGGKLIRNDRLVAVPEGNHSHSDARKLKDLDTRLLDEIQHFFEQYAAMFGKQVMALRRAGVGTAEKLIRKGERRYRENGEA
jgi:inorganic pyrophosphatase